MPKAMTNRSGMSFFEKFGSVVFTPSGGRTANRTVYVSDVAAGYFMQTLTYHFPASREQTVLFLAILDEFAPVVMLSPR